MKSFKASFYSVLFTLPCLPALANATELEEVVITATPIGQTDLSLAQPVTVLAGGDLQNRVTSSIGETLAYEPGISSTAFGAGASRPIIRGQGGSRVRVLDSGISSMDVSNLSPDHSVGIEPLATTQIEVLKGPATLLYGSGASGGVVNVVTNRIAETLPESPELQIKAQYNTVSEERSGAFSGDTSVGSVALHLDGSSRRTDDYDIPGYGSLEPEADEKSGTLAHSNLSTSSLDGGASYIGDNGYLGIGIGHYQSNYGIPGEGAHIELDQDRYDIKGQLENPLTKVEKIKLQLGHVDYKHTEFEPDGEAGTVFLNDEYEGRLEIVHAPVNDWHGALGTQVNYREFEAVGDEALTPPLNLRSLAVFLVEERDWDDWHLELGGRVERQDIDPENDAPATEHSIYSLSGGVIWQFSDTDSVGLNLSRAQRAPSLEELYNHGPHEATSTYEVGNFSLDAETANNLDLTLRHEQDNFDWQLNLFYNRIQNYVFGQTQDTDSNGVADFVDDDGELTSEEDALLLIYYAQQNATLYGFETTLSYTLNQDESGELTGHASLDYVRGRLESDENLPRITPMRLGLGLDYQKGNWQGLLDLFHVFDQSEIAPLETETDGYTLLEASVSYSFNMDQAEYELALRGRNLLDEEARSHTSFLKNVAPLPGRAFILSFTARL